MAINPEYASVINRYISSLQVPAPLQINLLCTGSLSESIKDIMREVLKMHYETEEARVAKLLESATAASCT